MGRDRRCHKPQGLTLYFGPPWMFIGHPEAGDRTAILYSIVVSCQRHRIDPFANLKDVLTRLPAMTNQDDLAPLLPGRWGRVTRTGPHPTAAASAP